jgi:hypothetical protein
VWYDENANGVQEIGEPGINGVCVLLYWLDNRDPDPNNWEWKFVRSMTTTSIPWDGFYIFQELPAGDYRVVVKENEPDGDCDNNFLPGGPLTCNDVPMAQTYDYSGPLDNMADVNLPSDDTVFVLADFGYVCPQPGTGTPGYWKTHPEAWPTDCPDVTYIDPDDGELYIWIGGVAISQEEAIAWMEASTKKDKTLNLFEHLVAAKLNTCVMLPDGTGNAVYCIEDVIVEADSWMAIHPVGTGVRANSLDWKQISSQFDMLVDYNEGKLCAPSRDFFE